MVNKLRGSYDTASAQTAIHIVSAWASTQQVALGQLKVADHSNEIPFIPQLLEMLSISGCIVTTDALKSLNRLLIVMRTTALKANQGQLPNSCSMVFLPDVERHRSDR